MGFVGVLEGGLQLSKRLDFGGSILKMQEDVRGGQNIKTQDWPSL